MTKNQYYAKCEEIKADVILIIDERIKKAAESGAVDFDQWEDNYLLPKITFSAIVREIERQFAPLTREHKKEVDNIYRFL